MTSDRRRHAAAATLVGNGLTVAITVAQAFILIPLSLMHLNAGVYGAWLSASEVLVWGQILDGGIPNLMTQRVGAALGREDHDEAARWSSTGLAGLLLLAAALSFAGWMAAPSVSRLLSVPESGQPEFIACFRLGVAGSTLLLLSNGLLGISRGVQRTALMSSSQVSSAVVGLVTAVVLLFMGWGLRALAIGLFVRGAIAMAGGVLFLVSLRHSRSSWWRQPSRACARDLLSLAPSMSGASLGYALANNSEILIVGSIFGPLPALTYALTRRAYDGIRSLLDTIAWAVSGGFAHLVAAKDSHRSRGVLREILWIRLALACLCGAVVMSVNGPFVALLFGAEHYGGVFLSFAFALQMILGGQSFLANFLLRSTGEVREGSWLLAAEAVLRVGAMVTGLFMFGLAAAPFAAFFVSLAAFVVVTKRLHKVLPAGNAGAPASGPLLGPALVLLVGIATALLAAPTGWLLLSTTALAVTIAGSVALLLTRPASEESVIRWSR